MEALQGGTAFLFCNLILDTCAILFTLHILEA